MIEPFPGGKIQTPPHRQKIVLTEEQIEWLRRYFPTNRADILRAKSGLSLSTFYRILKENNIHKTPGARSRIWRANCKRARETMKKNGYYDSLRGRKPTTAMIEGARRMWREVKEGKRKSPYEIYKDKHPRTWHRKFERIAETRKKIIRDEHFRMLSGMKRNTRLRLSVTHYTQSQRDHRYNAIKRGYWVYEDWSEAGGERYNIYYDADTERSQIFEKNLVADGFNVIDGSNL